MDNPN